MLRYGLVPDSGGPGRYRGGCGTLLEFQVFAPNTVVTARNRDRTPLPAWGIRGGRRRRQPRSFSRNPGTNSALELGNTDVVALDPGDILRVHGPGGGGYGTRLRPRRPIACCRDVRGGFVSVRRGPRRLRRRHPRRRIDTDGHRLASRPPPPATERAPFHPRPRPRRLRTAHDPRPLRRPDAHPVPDPGAMALYLKHRLLDAVFNASSDLPDGPRAIEQAYQALQQRFPELPFIDHPGA